MKLSDLWQKAGLSAPQTGTVPDIVIGGISSDSRTVRAGELFVAIGGLHRDGALFAKEALEKGAAFVIAERDVGLASALTVPDAREALARLWDAWYDHPAKDLTLIGITGTNGKTSTAFMLEWILREAGYKTGLIGTVECRCEGKKLAFSNPDALANMTTPDPAELYGMLAQMRDLGTTHVVMEVTSHALALQKAAPLRFARAVFTNLTVDHLDLHGDMENYFAAKRKLFTACGGAIVSLSTPYGARLCETLNCPFAVISPETVQNIRQYGAEGVGFTLKGSNGKMEIALPVPGLFSVENAALAATCADSLGVDGATIQSALAAFPGVKGRMERVDNPLGLRVFLDYAHTPDALEKLLLTVRGFAAPRERVLLLFGCGGDRDRGKRRRMGQIASRLSDLLILTSDNCRSEEPESILRDILQGVDKEKPYTVIVDRREAIEYALEIAQPSDILLLAGKGHEEYEIRGGERLPFSEREIVGEAIRRHAEREGRAH